MSSEGLQVSYLHSERKPILSLILCSRSDEYQGNSRWRLETALNYVGQSVAQLGREDDVEVIVVDWGSQNPLCDILKLTQEAAKIVSFMYVPPEIAKAEQKDSPFPEVLALNAAARRAKGEYIGRIDQDTLVGKQFLETIFWMYEKPRLLVPLEKALFLSNRRRITVRFTSRSPSLWTVDRFVRWFKRFLPLMDPLPPHLFYQSYVGIWLLHRDLWYECGGYDERFIYMDWQEVDMILRLTPKYTLINLGELTDHDLYHLDHAKHRPWSFGRYRKTVPTLQNWSVSRNRRTNPVRNLENRPDVFYPNDEDWGLMEYRFELLPPRPAQPGREAGSRDLPPIRWLVFLLSIFITGAQTAADRLIVSLMSARTVLSTISSSFHSVWGHRLRTAWETVRTKPLTRWPRLLINRWSEGRARHS
jgi:hypothetical protein